MTNDKEWEIEEMIEMKLLMITKEWENEGGLNEQKNGKREARAATWKRDES